MPLDDRVFANAERNSHDVVSATSQATAADPFLDVVVEGLSGESRTLLSAGWRRLFRNKMAVAALAYLTVVSLLALSAPLWVTRVFGDPIYINTSAVTRTQFLAPSLAHPMGTDQSGRDILARVIYGARVSLVVGFVATLISVSVGILFGAISGYYGGFVDSVVMRLTDVFLAFPYILLAILLISVMGMGLWPVLIAIGVLGWTTVARVLRSSVLSVKESSYVYAARAMGASDLRILSRHVLPNAVAPVVVYATMSVGGVILTEAALSFLGVGVQPPTPSWGGMLNEAQAYITTNPNVSIWPGLAIVLTVLSFVLLGDGLRDAFDVRGDDQ